MSELPAFFKIPGKTTLKTKVSIADRTISDVAKEANHWLWNQEQYTRIEIKYGKTYLVVAKLPDRGEDDQD